MALFMWYVCQSKGTPWIKEIKKQTTVKVRKNGINNVSMTYGALDASYLGDWLLCSDAQFDGKVTQFLKEEHE